MDGKKDTRTLDSNRLKDHDFKEGDTFDDPRLDKLWNKVTDVVTKQPLKCECLTHLQVYRLVHLLLALLKCSLQPLIVRPRLLESSLTRNSRPFRENSSTTKTESTSITLSWTLSAGLKVRVWSRLVPRYLIGFRICNCV